jgi:GNAT superfamily N-acetyltransferase
MWMPPSSPSAPEPWPLYLSSWLLWFQQGLLNIRFWGRGGLNAKRYWIWKEKQAKVQGGLWTDEKGYYFCNIVTVSPDAQGKGVGKLLMGTVLRRADREGVKCYLESSRERPNVEIYGRMGFKVVGEMECEEGGEVCKVSFLNLCALGQGSVC